MPIGLGVLLGTLLAFTLQPVFRTTPAETRSPVVGTFHGGRVHRRPRGSAGRTRVAPAGEGRRARPRMDRFARAERAARRRAQRRRPGHGEGRHLPRRARVALSGARRNGGDARRGVCGSTLVDDRELPLGALFRHDVDAFHLAQLERITRRARIPSPSSRLYVGAPCRVPPGRPTRRCSAPSARASRRASSPQSVT